MDYKEIRQIAKEKCDHNANMLAIIYLIYFTITAGLNFFQFKNEVGTITITSSVFGLGAFVLSGPLCYGLYRVIANNYNGINIEIKQLFSGFKYFLNLLVLEILVYLFTVLWTLLFIIPGIIKSFSYSMAIYVFLDDPTLSPMECIK